MSGRCGGKPGEPMPVRLVLHPERYIERCEGCRDCAPCATCKGEGSVERQIGGDGYGGRCCAIADIEVVCPDCGGDGIAKCETCGGSGREDAHLLKCETDCPDCGGTGRARGGE